MPGRISFSTTSDGAATITERLRITSAGHTQPGADNAYSLGISGTAWSDLFLGDGAVIGFGAGPDVTLTHASDRMTMAGGSLEVALGGGASTINPTASPLRAVAHSTTCRIWMEGVGVSTGGIEISSTNMIMGTESGRAIEFKIGCSATDTLGSAGTVVGKFFSDGGFVVGSPTGSTKGAGTINAVAVYDDNTLLTDYVFDHWQDGALNPDDVEKIREVAINTEHLDIDTFTASLIERRALPAMLRRSEWTEETRFSVGELAQRLWETVEIQAVHIAKLNDRLKTLEGLH
jgi:hypothetical protein